MPWASMELTPVCESPPKVLSGIRYNHHRQEQLQLLQACFPLLLCIRTIFRVQFTAVDRRRKRVDFVLLVGGVGEGVLNYVRVGGRHACCHLVVDSEEIAAQERYHLDHLGIEFLRSNLGRSSVYWPLGGFASSISNAIPLRQREPVEVLRATNKVASRSAGASEAKSRDTT
jgi:hypothetical protein